MASFEKSDLKYSTYNWEHNAVSNPASSASQNPDFLVLKDGYQVLPFINNFMTEYNLEKLATFQKIEEMINENLPSSIRNKEDIRKWLLANWNKH